MSYNPDGVQDLLEALTKYDLEIRLPEIINAQKLLQVVKQCAELKRTEQSVAILQVEIDFEINECYEKSYRCLMLQLQLAETVSAGRLDDEFALICESLVEIRKNFVINIKGRYQSRIQEVFQKLKELEYLAPLRQSCSEWVARMFAEDPEALVNQLEECKTKVDTAHKFLQEFKQEMESSRESFHRQIDMGIQMSKSLVEISQRKDSVSLVLLFTGFYLPTPNDEPLAEC
ncbi:unnamed protein product [Orchesella dallaii]|uniref:Uncharacterized protein n=1 Tax=Orchesella dallaii TaxID=48710 RepID=A0ABP1QM37_9HEXA